MLQSHFSLDISARYFEIAPRSRFSRHERVWCGEIALRSRRGVDISTRYFAISPRWWLSRRDLADLGAISARLPRSHRGLLFLRDILKSRRDRGYLAEISPISARLPRSRRDLGQIFTRVKPQIIFLSISQFYNPFRPSRQGSVFGTFKMTGQNNFGQSSVLGTSHKYMWLIKT